MKKQKCTMEFTTTPFDIGGRQGQRVQMVNKPGKFDMAFAEEVVKEKGLTISAYEALHVVEAFGEVGPAKVAEDGAARGVTKLIKWMPVGQGTVESPTSPWDDKTCRCAIRPQLLNEATKEIDATFVNVNDGIGVKLNYVAWLGAKTVINVVKVGVRFAAYGNHMEFDAALGDTATLTVGGAAYPLACVESDVAHAVFDWPAGLSPEAGTLAKFEMKSRGGVEDGQVYASKKTVTVLDGDTPTGPSVAKVTQAGRADDTVLLAQESPCTVHGTGLALGADDKVLIELRDAAGEILDEGDCTAKVVSSADAEIRLSGFAWQNLKVPDGDWWDAYPRSKLIVVKDGARLEHPITFKGE